MKKSVSKYSIACFSEIFSLYITVNNFIKSSEAIEYRTTQTMQVRILLN